MLQRNVGVDYDNLASFGGVYRFRSMFVLSPAAVPLEFTHHLRRHAELAEPDAQQISTYRALQHQHQR